MTGNDVRAIRQRMGWTIGELAEYWGLHRMTVQNWEARREYPVPHPKVMAILAEDLERHLESQQQESNDHEQQETE